MEADRQGSSRDVSRLLYYMPDPTERATDPDDEPQAAAGAPASSSGQMQAAPIYAAGVGTPSVRDAPADATPVEREPIVPAGATPIDRALAAIATTDQSLACRQDTYEFMRDRGYGGAETLAETITQRQALAEAQR